jgi:hypothetical protein
MAERLERDYSGAVCKFVMTAASWQTGSGSAAAHRAEGAWEREATRAGDAGPGRLSHHRNRQQSRRWTRGTGQDTGQDTGHGVGSVVARQAKDATRTRTRTRTADGRARARASRQQREGADKMLVAGGLHCLRGVTGKPEIRMQQPEIRGGRLRYGTGIQGHAPCLQAAAYSSACYALWPNKLRPCNQSTTSSRAAGQCPQNAELHGGGSSRLLT